VPLVGDELGAAAKMWCLWSKHSVFEVGEAVSVKRSDGRYMYIQVYIYMYTVPADTRL
jgi:hypothetical protein